MFKYLPLLLLLVSTAEARNRSEQFSVGASGGIAMPSPLGSEIFRNSVGTGIPKLSIFGRYHHASAYTGFELGGDYFQLSDTSLSSRSLTMSLFWRGMPLRTVHPIFSLGFGISRMQSFFRAGNGDQPFHRLRVGVEWEFTPQIDLAFHLDHFSVLKDNIRDQNLHVLAPSIAAIIYFGNPPPAVPTEAGASAPAQAKAEDGDADEDGVLDSADLCRGTLSGAKVNSAGCAVKQSFEQQISISFRSNVSTVAEYDRAAFAGIARVLAENSDMKAEIQGHTDSAGGPKKNLKLSQARAESVRQLMMKEFKVDASQLVAKGYGSAQPVDTNNNPQGRSNNRRVVVKISR